MNIREWYGFEGEYDKAMEINICVDGLLVLYAKAIMQYFSVLNVQNYREIQNIDRSNLETGQVLFLNWLNEKGFPYLTQLAAKHLPNDEELISHIEYDKYILEEEMDFEYPDDVRSSLISIVNDVPDYIMAATEVSVSVSVDQIGDSWVTWLTEHQVVDTQTGYLGINYYRIKENEYSIANDKEAVLTAGSLFLFRGNFFGNFGLLQVN
jgi:hypothetical protein